MKKIFLALLLCGMAVVSKADGDIINEDFSSEEFNVITANANANYLIKEWKFFKC